MAQFFLFTNKRQILQFSFIFILLKYYDYDRYYSKIWTRVHGIDCADSGTAGTPEANLWVRFVFNGYQQLMHGTGGGGDYRYFI